MCWDCTADEPLARRIVELARTSPTSRARILLSEIGDPAAAPVLRELLADPDHGLRVRAINSLGWSGDESDVELVAPLLGDRSVRATATATIAELGGPRAADLLWECATDPDEPNPLKALRGLAWLRDPRALNPLRESIPQWLGSSATGGLRNELLRLGGPAERESLLHGAEQLVARARSDEPLRHRAGSAVQQVLELATGSRWEALLASVEELGMPWIAGNARIPLGPRPVADEWGPRTVPSRAMLIGVAAAARDGRPQPRFRGQPDWRDEPAWPVGHAGPLMFLGQLPVPGDRTAYMFAAEYDNWEPLGTGNAVVVQPGPPPQLRTLPMRTGPQVFEWVREERFRRRSRRLPAPELPVALFDWADPEDWDQPEEPPRVAPFTDEDPYWNKLGGTPYWLQGPQELPGDGWHFAFQFDAEGAGRELGDGAECYGFVHDDGRGAFLWQCH